MTKETIIHGIICSLTFLKIPLLEISFMSSPTDYTNLKLPGSLEFFVIGDIQLFAFPDFVLNGCYCVTWLRSICFLLLYLSRHPAVKWAQRSDKLFITVELPDAKNVKLKLEPEGKFFFSATAGADNVPYEVDLDLFDKINVDVSEAPSVHICM